MPSDACNERSCETKKRKNNVHKSKTYWHTKLRIFFCVYEVGGAGVGGGAWAGVGLGDSLISNCIEKSSQ